MEKKHLENLSTTKQINGWEWVVKKVIFPPNFWCRKSGSIILYCLKMQAHILILTHMHVRMLRMLLCGRKKKHNFGEYFVNLKYKYILSVNNWTITEQFYTYLAYPITRKTHQKLFYNIFLSVGELIFIFPFWHELFF